MRGRSQITGKANAPRNNPNVRLGMSGRDRMLEAQVAPKCVVCETTILRPMQKNGPQAISQWMRRKTCQGPMDEFGRPAKRSDCYRIYINGKGNPNYRGIMPRCVDCGTKTAYVTRAERKDGVKDAHRCAGCFKRFAHETGWYIEHANAAVIPWVREHLDEVREQVKKYAFKKGRIATNKKHDNCTVPECGKKHLARGYCGAHYREHMKGLKKGLKT